MDEWMDGWMNLGVWKYIAWVGGGGEGRGGKRKGGMKRK